MTIRFKKTKRFEVARFHENFEKDLIGPDLDSVEGCHAAVDEDIISGSEEGFLIGYLGAA